MKKNNNKILNDLLGISTRINQIYISLWKLEISNKKNSNEYTICQNKLKELTIAENKLYESLDSKKAYDLLSTINEGIIYTFDELINSIYDKPDDIIEARVVYKLKKIVNKNPVVLNDTDLGDFNLEIEELEEEIDDIENNLIGNYYEDDNCIGFDLDYENYYELSSKIESDILHTIITILNTYINNRKYKQIKAELIKYRYILTFIFSPLEKSYLNNEQSSDSILYWESKLFADYQNVANSIFENIKDYTVESILYSHIDNLLALLSENIHKGKNYVHAISSQILIRSCLLFASEDSIDAFIYSTFDDLLESGVSNDEICNIIFNSLNKLKKDKEIPQTLCLKLD